MNAPARPPAIIVRLEREATPAIIIDADTDAELDALIHWIDQDPRRRELFDLAQVLAGEAWGKAPQAE